MTLNLDFVLNCVLCQHVWSSEAWLSKHGWSYTCKECCWRTSTEKNTCGIARFPCGSTAFLYCVAFCSCTLIWAAYRFCLGLPDLASSYWVHSLCLGCFVCVILFSCIISACMLYYCNTVRWAWLDWGLSGWLTTLLQCFDTVGWAIRPVKTVGRITYIVLAHT